MLKDNNLHIVYTVHGLTTEYSRCAASIIINIKYGKITPISTTIYVDSEIYHYIDKNIEVALQKQYNVNTVPVECDSDYKRHIDYFRFYVLKFVQKEYPVLYLDSDVYLYKAGNTVLCDSKYDFTYYYHYSCKNVSYHFKPFDVDIDVGSYYQLLSENNGFNRINAGCMVFKNNEVCKNIYDLMVLYNDFCDLDKFVYVEALLSYFVLNNDIKNSNMFNIGYGNEPSLYLELSHDCTIIDLMLIENNSNKMLHFHKHDNNRKILGVFNYLSESIDLKYYSDDIVLTENMYKNFYIKSSVNNTNIINGSNLIKL